MLKHYFIPLVASIFIFSSTSCFSANENDQSEFEHFVKAFNESIKSMQKCVYQLNGETKVSANGATLVIQFQEEGKLDFQGKRFYNKIAYSNDAKGKAGESKIYECIEKEDEFFSASFDKISGSLGFIETRTNSLDYNWIDNLRFSNISFFLGFVQYPEKNNFVLDLVKRGTISISVPIKAGDDYILSSVSDKCNIRINYSESTGNFFLNEISVEDVSGKLDVTDTSKLLFRVTQRDSQGIPMEYTLEKTIQGGSKKLPGINEPFILPLKTSFTRVKIMQFVVNHQFNDSDFTFTFPIPNGTEVFVQGAPQIQYVWMDGKPVVKTDEIALRIARGDHGFMPGPKNPRFWFIVFGFGLLLLGGGLKIRTMLKGEG